MKALALALVLSLVHSGGAHAAAAAAPVEKVQRLRAGSGGAVTFVAVGKPSMLKIHGKSENPEADLKVEGLNLAGTVTVLMDRFATGIPTRDKHMKEKYLEVAKYPRAVLTLEKAAVPAGFAEKLSSGGEKEFTGRLSLHGKEQPVKGTFAVDGGKLTAKFPLKITDYAIEVPNYLGITVADSVDVAAEIPLQRE